MKFDWAATYISYSVEITEEQLQVVLDKDVEVDNIKLMLFAQLEDIEGVDNVDYDGHFGPYIFVKMAFVDDTQQTRDKIEEIINNFING